ncbi:MAG TPA: VWA domain-containing protein [Micromonosporaceae bacterium]|nr:VWA domain-containing protein [Micromonosporaceae bacterium]
MSLSWPWALVALLAFPLLLGVRWWMRRRRRRTALRVSSVALIRAALPQRSLWRRRIPLGLFAVGLVVLSVGAARPQATVLVPTDSSSILLAMDVSTSMCSADVAPNRITAAEKAASDFIKAQHDGTKIGLVVFSGVAALLVPPTTDRQSLLSAVGTLRTSRGTAIGLGILTSLDAISQINPNVAASGVDLQPGTGPADGPFEPDSIVVLTDGANTQGVDPVTAAQQAAARHVRIYTIGFGTTEPAAFVCSPDQIGPGSAFGTGRPGGRGFGGGGFRGGQQIDEDALSQVASITGGKYFQAKDAKELTDTLIDLPTSIALQHRRSEITVWFALVGALFVIAAVGLTQWWSRPKRLRTT